MLVLIDGKTVGYLKSPGIAHPTKQRFGFTVPGTTGAMSDDVVLSAAAAVPDWAARRTEILASLRKSDARKRK